MAWHEELVGRFMVDGVDLYSRYGLMMSDEYDLGTPEPKTHTVDIPAANGSLDLTEAMAGDVVYKNRSMSFTFYLFDVTDINQELSAIRNFLHGQRYSFVLGIDPEYTYTGRFTVAHWSLYSRGAYKIVVDVDAEPYKIKGKYTYALQATGGRTYVFESGRMPTHPIVESTDDFYIEWEGEYYNCAAGTYMLRYITFHEGENVIYITSSTLENVTWDDVGEAGNLAMTWDELANYTWSEIQKLQYWDEDQNEDIVYLQYEWGDL